MLLTFQQARFMVLVGSLAVLPLLTLAGCGGKTPEPAAVDAAAPPTAEPADEPEDEQLTAIGDHNLHDAFNSPFWKDHDIVRITDLRDGSTIYVDPTLYDAIGIGRVTGP